MHCFGELIRSRALHPSCIDILSINQSCVTREPVKSSFPHGTSGLSNASCHINEAIELEDFMSHKWSSSGSKALQVSRSNEVASVLRVPQELRSDGYLALLMAEKSCGTL